MHGLHHMLIHCNFTDLHSLDLVQPNKWLTDILWANGIKVHQEGHSADVAAFSGRLRSVVQLTTEVCNMHLQILTLWLLLQEEEEQQAMVWRVAKGLDAEEIREWEAEMVNAVCLAAKKAATKDAAEQVTTSCCSSLLLINMLTAALCKHLQQWHNIAGHMLVCIRTSCMMLLQGALGCNAWSTARSTSTNGCRNNGRLPSAR